MRTKRINRAAKQLPGRQRAQVAIEFTIALLCLVVFLVATTKIFAWFGNSIVQRHNDFEDTRVAAATKATTDSQIDFHQKQDLDIFQNWNFLGW